MANPHISANWQDALDVRFHEFWEGYSHPPTMLEKIFRDVGHSGRHEIKFTRAGTFPDYVPFNGQVEYQQRFQGYDVTATYLSWTNGFTVSRNLWNDDQYHLFDGEPVEMKKAAYRTREKHGAQIFTLAFSANSSFFVNSEGVAMCSDSHTTTASGVSTASGFDNKGTAAFSATALAAARIQMKQYLGDQAEIIETNPNTLLYPTDLYDRVHEVVKSEKRPQDATNASNVHYEQFNQWEWRYLDQNPDNWFLLDSEMMKRNLVWSDREPLEFGKVEDFETFNYKTRSYMRYAFAWTDWRHVFGAEVT